MPGMTTGRKTCAGCGAELVWAKTPEGATIPLDAKAPTYDVQRDMLNDQVALRSPALVSHFAVCPKANDFSKGGRR